MIKITLSSLIVKRASNDKRSEFIDNLKSAIEVKHPGELIIVSFDKEDVGLIIDGSGILKWDVYRVVINVYDAMEWS